MKNKIILLGILIGLLSIVSCKKEPVVEKKLYFRGIVNTSVSVTWSSSNNDSINNFGVWGGHYILYGNGSNTLGHFYWYDGFSIFTIETVRFINDKWEPYHPFDSIRIYRDANSYGSNGWSRLQLDPSTGQPVVYNKYDKLMVIQSGEIVESYSVTVDGEPALDEYKTTPYKYVTHYRPTPALNILRYTYVVIKEEIK